MADQDYSIEELEQKTGIDKRVIRSYIEQGLLLGPASRGRYARYSELQLLRLRAIKTLKDTRQMSLTEVRLALATMTDEDIYGLLIESDQKTQKSKHTSDNSPGSVLDYLRSARASSLSEPPKRRTEDLSSAGPAALSSSQINNPIQVLLSVLNRIAENKRSTRQTKGEHWHKFSITSDVELSVRGLNDTAQVEQWERISDSLRIILLGGAKNE